MLVGLITRRSKVQILTPLLIVFVLFERVDVVLGVGVVGLNNWGTPFFR